MTEDGASPIGFIDSPRASEAVPLGPVDVLGWVLVQDVPAEVVAVIVDGQVVGRGKPLVHRPDVIEALGLTASDLCGFEFSIDLSALPGVKRGPLDLSVAAAADGRGREIPFASVTVEVGEPLQTLQVRGHLDTPFPDAEVSPRHVLIEGWAAIGDHPARSVVITVDDLVVGVARVGLPRPDIADGFGEPNLKWSGFALTVELGDIQADHVRLTATTFAGTGAEGSRQAFQIDQVTVRLVEPAPAEHRVFDVETLRELASDWWYYSVELAPGVVAKGIDYEWDIPMLPRMLMRSCDLADKDCLDLGSMEGLIPILMKRKGARSALATDYDDRLMRKIEAVQYAYGVDFEYETVGLMYDLHKKLTRRSFDFINCSGLLYHTWSPLHVLAGVRPLLRRNGLMIVSTIVNLDDESFMEFNLAGHLNPECNTFWYVSVGWLGYVLRYLHLRPVDVLYFVHDEHWRTPGHPLPKVRRAYVSVLCRATQTAEDDPWMEVSSRASIEYLDITDWSVANSQTISTIATVGDRRDISDLSLFEAIQSSAPIPELVPKRDTHFLHLADES